MNALEKRAKLAGAIKNNDFVVAPGVFEMISARVADELGFRALYMTGYGVAASHLGVPDAGIASFADVVGRVRTIANGVNTPLICDGDTGFGGLLNVKHTVQGYEDAGACAIQLEDQEMPKKCGHTLGRAVIPLEEMLLKIQVAAESRRDPNFLIIARTDSRTTLGLDEAIRRGKAFGDAGADVVFVESPESEDEMERVGQEIDYPLFANMVESGRTPIVQADRLKALGYNIAIYPAIAMLSMAAALRTAFTSLHQDGTSDNITVPRISLTEMHSLMHFEEVWDFDKRWARNAAE